MTWLVLVIAAKVILVTNLRKSMKIKNKNGDNILVWSKCFGGGKSLADTNYAGNQLFLGTNILEGTHLFGINI